VRVSKDDVGARFIAPAPTADQRPQRCNTRLAGFDYSQAGAFFVTVCTAGRRCLFGNIVDDAMVLTPIGRLVQEVWEEIPTHHEGVQTDAFMVMPNHVHGVIVQVGLESAMSGAPTLGEVVRAWKARVTVEGRRRALVHGPLWQRGYHDHIVRDDQDLDRIRRYIDDNPMAWALDEENPLRHR